MHASLPSAITVPAGTTRLAFPIETSLVYGPALVTITAAHGNTEGNAWLTVTPPSGNYVAGLNVTPSFLAGGTTAAATVTLAMPSDEIAGSDVLVASSSPAILAPSSVHIDRHDSSATFTVTAAAVTEPVAVALTATYGGVTQRARMIVAPEGSTIDYTDKYARQLESIYAEAPAVNRVYMIVGSPDVSRGISFVRFKDWNDRDVSAKDIAAWLRPRMSALPGIMAFPSLPASLGASIRSKPVEIVIVNSDEYTDLERVVNNIIAKAQDDVHELQALGHDPLKKTRTTASLSVGLLAIILEDASKANGPDILIALLERATRAISYSVLNPLAEYYFDEQRRA